MNQKTKKRMLALVLGAALVIGTLSLFTLSIGGTAWQLDYEITNFIVNGEAQNLEELPDGETYTEPETWTGGEGDFGVTFDTTYKDPFVWWVDVDGQPIYTGAIWDGLLSDVGVSVSLPWREDVSGNKIDFNFDDPNQVAHNYGDKIVYEYYYGFTVEMATKSDTFTVPGTLQSGWQAWQSCEGGSFDLSATLTVFMGKRSFTNVTGTFADAKIREVTWIDLQLQSGLDWQVTPHISIMQDVNTGVPIANRQEGDDYYLCDLSFVAGLGVGMVKSGLNRLPYDVWLVKEVQMTILLEQPLDIGSTGEGQEPEDPPTFIPEFPLWLLILIAILGTIIIVAVAYMVGKLGPVFAAIGGKS